MILVAPFKIYEDEHVSTKPVVFRRVKTVPFNPFKKKKRATQDNFEVRLPKK